MRDHGSNFAQVRERIAFDDAIYTGSDSETKDALAHHTKRTGADFDARVSPSRNHGIETLFGAHLERVQTLLRDEAEPVDVDCVFDVVLALHP